MHAHIVLYPIHIMYSGFVGVSFLQSHKSKGMELGCSSEFHLLRKLNSQHGEAFFKDVLIASFNLITCWLLREWHNQYVFEESLMVLMISYILQLARDEAKTYRIQRVPRSRVREIITCGCGIYSVRRDARVYNIITHLYFI